VFEGAEYWTTPSAALATVIVARGECGRRVHVKVFGEVVSLTALPTTLAPSMVRPLQLVIDMLGWLNVTCKGAPRDFRLSQHATLSETFPTRTLIERKTTREDRKRRKKDRKVSDNP
jgi:hypothetical protein